MIEQDDVKDVEIEGLADMMAEEREEHQAAKLDAHADVGVTTTKSAKVESKTEKHAAEDPEGGKASKQPRLDLSRQPGTTTSTSSGLQASPMNAASIGRASTYGGVDVYVEDEDEEFAEPYVEDLLSGMDFLDDEAFGDEKHRPPEVDEATLQSLDQAAAIEEIDRLRKLLKTMKHIQEKSWCWILDKSSTGDIVMDSGNEDADWLQGNFGLVHSLQKKHLHQLLQSMLSTFC